jgi:hypothetical protein
MDITIHASFLPHDDPDAAILLATADPRGVQTLVPTVDFAPRRSSNRTVHTGSM